VSLSSKNPVPVLFLYFHRTDEDLSDSHGKCGGAAGGLSGFVAKSNAVLTVKT